MLWHVVPVRIARMSEVQRHVSAAHRLPYKALLHLSPLNLHRMCSLYSLRATDSGVDTITVIIVEQLSRRKWSGS